MVSDLGLVTWADLTNQSSPGEAIQAELSTRQVHSMKKKMWEGLHLCTYSSTGIQEYKNIGFLQ